MAPPSSFQPTGTPPAVFVYSLADAEAALAAVADDGGSLDLWIREDTAAGYGAAVIGRIFSAARTAYPTVRFRACVDCGDAPGLALALLRRRIDRVHLVGSAALLDRIADIAGRTGAALAPLPADPLDLLDVDEPKKACAMWRSRFPDSGRLPNQ